MYVGALTPGDLAINFYSVQDAADRTRVFAVNAMIGQGLFCMLGFLVMNILFWLIPSFTYAVLAGFVSVWR